MCIIICMNRMLRCQLAALVATSALVAASALVATSALVVCSVYPKRSQWHSRDDVPSILVTGLNEVHIRRRNWWQMTFEPVVVINQVIRSWPWSNIDKLLNRASLTGSLISCCNNWRLQFLNLFWDHFLTLFLIIILANGYRIDFRLLTCHRLIHRVTTIPRARLSNRLLHYSL